MSARAAGMFTGGVVASAGIVYVAGWAAAIFYCFGLVAGPSLYLSRAPWKL